MISIAVTNRKGGTGKTTVSTHLAGYWATIGYKVLLIDTDPQGDAGRSVGVAPKDGLYDLLVEQKPLINPENPAENIVRAVAPDRYSVPDAPPAGALFILPSASRTSAISSLIDDPFLLADKVADFKSMFDIVILDTAPTISAFDAFAYLASDYFIFVTQCEQLSMTGLDEGIRQVSRYGAKRKQYGLGEESHVLGIIPNMIDARLVAHRMMLESLVERYGEKVWKPVMMRAKYKEASIMSQLIYSYAPTGGEAEDMRKVARQAEKAVNHVVSG